MMIKTNEKSDLEVIIETIAKIYNHIEIRKLRKIPNEAMHKMLIEHQDSDYTQKVFDAKTAHMKPTSNPLVSLYRRIRNR